MSDKKTLHLTIKKQWFDMIKSGEKKEEYRAIKSYWLSRLIYSYDEYEVECMIDCLENGGDIDEPRQGFRFYDYILFRNGYSKNSRTLLVECKGIDVDYGNPIWGGRCDKKQFVIKLGKVIEQ